VQRVWREESLRVPRARRRKRAVGEGPGGRDIDATAPDEVWALDFQADQTSDGRPIRMVNVIDEHTREAGDAAFTTESARAGDTIRGALSNDLEVAAGELVKCSPAPHVATAAADRWLLPAGEQYAAAQAAPHSAHLPLDDPLLCAVRATRAGPGSERRRARALHVLDYKRHPLHFAPDPDTGRPREKGATIAKQLSALRGFARWLALDDRLGVDVDPRIPLVNPSGPPSIAHVTCSEPTKTGRAKLTRTTALLLRCQPDPLKRDDGRPCCLGSSHATALTCATSCGEKTARATGPRFVLKARDALKPQTVFASRRRDRRTCPRAERSRDRSNPGRPTAGASRGPHAIGQRQTARPPLKLTTRLLVKLNRCRRESTSYVVNPPPTPSAAARHSFRRGALSLDPPF
jgi:hypothetical protein